MKVLFFTEGNSDVGFGHVTRCNSLYEEFLNRGITPLLVINGDGTIEGLLKGKKYEILDWVQDKKKTEALAENARVIVVDSYLAPGNLYEYFSSAAPVPVFLDDYKRLDYPKGIVLNASAGAEKLGYPAKDGTEYWLGAPYILLRQAFKKFPKRQFPPTIKTIMVTFGGDDWRNLTPIVIKRLTKAYPGCQLKVIVGRGYKHRDDVEKLKSPSTDIIFDPTAEQMSSVMAMADAAVSAGGQTLGEMAAQGLPVVAVAVVENQLNNVRGLTDAGYVEYAGWWEDSSVIDNVLAGLKRLEDPDIRKNRSERGRQIVDGKGSARIVNEVLGRLRG